MDACVDADNVVTSEFTSCIQAESRMRWVSHGNSFDLQPVDPLESVSPMPWNVNRCGTRKSRISTGLNDPIVINAVTEWHLVSVHHNDCSRWPFPHN